MISTGIKIISLIMAINKVKLIIVPTIFNAWKDESASTQNPQHNNKVIMIMAFPVARYVRLMAYSKDFSFRFSIRSLLRKWTVSSTAIPNATVNRIAVLIFILIPK